MCACGLFVGEFALWVLLGFSRQMFMSDYLWFCVALSGGILYEFDVADNKYLYIDL